MQIFYDFILYLSQKLLSIMTTTKIYLETPDDIHAKIKRIQFNRQEKGQKVNLKELYYEILRKGLDQYEKKNPAE